MIKKPLVFVFAIFVLAPQAEAGWHFKGGDPVAIEFQNSAEVAIQEIVSDAQDFPQIKGVDFDKILSETKVMVSDDPLYVENAGVKQESTAVNSIDLHTIIVNRARWNAIQAAEIKNALALHEVLSLGGIEDTGDYTVSARYLSLRGLQCTTDICSGSPVGVEAFSFETAQAAFASAKLPTRDQLTGTWEEIGVAELPTGLSKPLAEYSEDGFLNMNTTKDFRYEQAVDLTFRDLVGPFGDTRGLEVGYDYRLQYVPAGSYSTETPDYYSTVYTVSFGTTGIHFETSGNLLPMASSPNSPDGNFNYECRISSTDRLLCSGVYSTIYSGIPSGRTVRYLMLVPVTISFSFPEERGMRSLMPEPL